MALPPGQFGGGPQPGLTDNTVQLLGLGEQRRHNQAMEGVANQGNIVSASNARTAAQAQRDVAQETSASFGNVAEMNQRGDQRRQAAVMMQRMMERDQDAAEFERVRKRNLQAAIAGEMASEPILKRLREAAARRNELSKEANRMMVESVLKTQGMEGLKVGAGKLDDLFTHHAKLKSGAIQGWKNALSAAFAAVERSGVPDGSVSYWDSFDPETERRQAENATPMLARGMADAYVAAMRPTSGAKRGEISDAIFNFLGPSLYIGIGSPDGHGGRANTPIPTSSMLYDEKHEGQTYGQRASQAFKTLKKHLSDPEVDALLTVFDPLEMTGLDAAQQGVDAMYDGGGFFTWAGEALGFIDTPDERALEHASRLLTEFLRPAEGQLGADEYEAVEDKLLPEMGGVDFVRGLANLRSTSENHLTLPPHMTLRDLTLMREALTKSIELGTVNQENIGDFLAKQGATDALVNEVSQAIAAHVPDKNAVSTALDLMGQVSDMDLMIEGLLQQSDRAAELARLRALQ